MPSLLIVTGPPGAGKSTVGSLVAEAYDLSVRVEGDAFFAFLAEGVIEPWRPESHHQNEVVTEAAARATGRFAVDYDTIYEGVVGPWFLPTFAGAAGVATLDYVILLPTLETCIQRVRSRVGHGFTNEEATAKMHREFSSAPMDDRHRLSLDAETTLGHVVAEILDRRRRGLLRYEV